MTSLAGSTELGSGCEIGPMAVLHDVRAGQRVVIGESRLDGCELGDDVRIGAYCRVRPNTVLASGVELGTHAEVKNSTVGAGTRISHFSCVLDSDVGEGVNIGAGTVTCNYDGSAKYRTVIGDRVFVGPTRPWWRRFALATAPISAPARSSTTTSHRGRSPSAGAASATSMDGRPAGRCSHDRFQPYGELLLLSGSGNPELSERIAREIGVKLANARSHDSRTESSTSRSASRCAATMSSWCSRPVTRSATT